MHRVRTARLRSGCALFAIAAAVVMLHSSVQAQTWLLDTFDDDTPGTAPNDPEVGSVFRACSAGLTCDKYTVIGSAGDGRLHVNGEVQGLGLQWFLSSPASGQGTVSYRFTPLPGGTTAGANAFRLQLNLAPFGTNTILMFGDEDANGLSLQFGFTAPGDSSQTLQALPTKVLRGREVLVQWAFDTTADRIDLRLDGSQIASKTFAGGLDDVFATSSVSNFATTAAWTIDDVQALAVPEPRSLALMLAGLAGLVARAWTRTRSSGHGARPLWNSPARARPLACDPAAAAPQGAQYRRLVKELSLRYRANLAEGRQIPASASQHRALLTAIAAADAERASRALRARTCWRARTARSRTSAAPRCPPPQRKLAMIEVNGRRYRSARLGPESCVSPQSADGRNRQSVTLPVSCRSTVASIRATAAAGRPP